MLGSLKKRAGRCLRILVRATVPSLTAWSLYRPQLSLGANYSRMTEMITPYNRALAMPDVTGAWSFDTLQGLARIAKEITRQATMIGYLNAFTMYTVASGLAVVFALFIRGRQAK